MELEKFITRNGIEWIIRYLEEKDFYDLLDHINSLVEEDAMILMNRGNLHWRRREG
ncbi:hypothetical protein [Acidianus manzaensis]|uniref:hypothetical protein n=1 Tax=Acidianus manzaensis TaxID=282676 RepID=UPI00164F2E8E|nr:hypothetical protein [Acidianus manzaensis]